MITNILIFFAAMPFGFFGWKYRAEISRSMSRPRRRLVADPMRIHRLEYDLGFRDDPPPLRTNPVHAILKDQWTSGRLPPKTAKALVSQMATESELRRLHPNWNWDEPKVQAAIYKAPPLVPVDVKNREARLAWLAAKKNEDIN